LVLAVPTLPFCVFNLSNYQLTHLPNFLIRAHPRKSAVKTFAFLRASAVILAFDFFLISVIRVNQW
jgi:hypothetical protein